MSAVQKALLVCFLLYSGTLYATDLAGSLSKISAPSPWKTVLLKADDAKTPSKIGEIIFVLNEKKIFYTIYELGGKDIFYQDFTHSIDSIDYLRALPFVIAVDNVLLIRSDANSDKKISPADIQILKYYLSNLASDNHFGIIDNKLTIGNWITIFSALLLVAGWFIGSALNRKHEIAKEQLKYRLEALKGCLNVLLLIKNTKPGHLFDTPNKIMDKIQTSGEYIYIYGEAEEIEKFNSIKEKILQSSECQEETDNLISMLKKKIRKELNLK